MKDKHAGRDRQRQGIDPDTSAAAPARTIPTPTDEDAPRPGSAPVSDDSTAPVEADGIRFDELDAEIDDIDDDIDPSDRVPAPASGPARASSAFGAIRSEPVGSSETAVPFSGRAAARHETPSTRIPDDTDIDVALPPAPRHEAPADEVAVSIDETRVDPAVLDESRPMTRTISVAPVVSGPTPKSASDATGTMPAVTPTAAPASRSEAAPGASKRSAYDALLGSTEVPGGPSRRERLRGEQSHSPESSAMLTADRLLEVNRKTRPAPTGGWNRFLYAVSFHGINRGDSAKVKAYKAMDERIQRSFEGGTRFVPILTRKGGVGKTTVTALLGMALADAREDRIIAIDANPDRGTLSERVPKQTRATVRDVVTRAASITGFTDFSTLVSRDDTRLDILASDTDPQLSEAFDEDDYNVVANLVERYYSIMLTDCGTGIVHSVMRATLQRADSVVIVSGGSVDEARLASETLTWLDANGYSNLVRNAIVALNTATQGTNLVKLEEIESHFRSRVRDVVRIPYDPQLAAGSVMNFHNLKPITKEAARLLAALVVEGLPVRRGV